MNVCRPAVVLSGKETKEVGLLIRGRASSTLTTIWCSTAITARTNSKVALNGGDASGLTHMVQLRLHVHKLWVTMYWLGFQNAGWHAYHTSTVFRVGDARKLPLLVCHLEKSYRRIDGTTVG